MIALSQAEEERYVELQQMALDFARSGDSETLRSMIEAGIPVNLSDTKGNTLLMLASYNGHPETVKMLLESNADTERRNDHGQTPLGGVAFKGYLEICKMLTESGAEIDADQGGGRTSLMFAALFGRQEIVSYLQNAGADQTTQKFLGFSVARIAMTTRTLRRITSSIRRLFTPRQRAKYGI